MTRVLITGGAGFIGSWLAERLVQDGATVTILDDLTTGDPANLSNISDCKFVIDSVTNSEIVCKLIAETDIVFHLAARNIVTSTRNPIEDFATNIGGTLNALMAAKKYNVTRFIYASSASVYGNPKYLPACEDDPVCLLTPYAVSKFAGEGYCQAFFESYGVPTVALRYSNVYGLRQRGEGVVMRFTQAVQNNQPIRIHGHGRQTRDYTWVGDAINATLLAARSGRAVGEVFNIGTGIETSVTELARSIGKDGTVIEYIDRRDIDNISRRVLNIEKSRRMLRWIPVVSLEQGLSLLRENQ